MKFETNLQERERIDDTLAMLDEAPQADDDEGARELASKQHAMWIAELLNNSWSDSVAAEMNPFEEEHWSYQGGHHCYRATTQQRKASS